MAIRIASKKDGFRRAGIEHPSAPTIYPEGTFTEEQLDALREEDMLIVDEVPDEPPAASGKNKEKKE